MNIFVTGGGTGGHMYPALAIAKKFKKEGNEVIYLGGEEMEADLWPKDEFPFEYVHAMGREFGGIKEIFDIFKYNSKGIIEALRLIKKYKPACVIGTGGYVEFPIILAAYLKGIPCYLQEQNAIPGRSNLVLSKFVKKIFLGFNEAQKEFENKDKIIYTGNPVREEFLEKTREKSRKILNLNDEFLLLVTGGSLGSPNINKIAIELAKKIESVDNIKMVLSYGTRERKKVNDALNKSDLNVNNGGNIEFYPYIDNISDYLTSSDLVIERSGAISLTETLLKGIPSVLIPSKYVYKNHQFYNAKVASDFGAAIVIDEDTDIDEIVQQVLNLIDDKKKLKDMALKARELAKEDSLDIIYNIIIKDINGIK